MLFSDPRGSSCIGKILSVLILVVMDAVLWPSIFLYSCFFPFLCLNPCCNGCCSLTRRAYHLFPTRQFVLILVVMDAVLWHAAHDEWVIEQACLNPCCNGCCSLTDGEEPLERDKWFSLNPCCNGCCSLTLQLIIFNQIGRASCRERV